MAVEFLYLDRSLVKSLCPSMEETIVVLEEVFRWHVRRQTVMPPKVPLDLEEECGGHLNLMPAYLRPWKIAGVKLIAAYANNRSRGLPSATALINLYDPETGLPLCIMDGSYVTLLRTGAVTAIMAKHLAKPDTRVVTLVGLGATAPFHLRGIVSVLPIEHVRGVDPDHASAERFVSEVSEELQVEITITDDYYEAVCGSDLIVTATRMTKPTALVREEWLKPGSTLLVTSMVCDVDVNVVKKMDRFYVDDLAQCRTGGAFYEAFQQGLLTDGDVTGEIGEVLIGDKAGRTDAKQRILGWHRGMATHDVAVAQVVFDRAEQKGVGMRLPLMD